MLAAVEGIEVADAVDAEDDGLTESGDDSSWFPGPRELFSGTEPMLPG
jgi:hypothetical protein